MNRNLFSLTSERLLLRKLYRREREIKFSHQLCIYANLQRGKRNTRNEMSESVFIHGAYMYLYTYTLGFSFICYVVVVVVIVGSGISYTIDFAGMQGFHSHSCNTCSRLRGALPRAQSLA